MLICVKKVLRNGRNALAWCAKDSEGEYKDGTLPSGKSIDDYHRFIRERDIRRKGSISVGDDDKADDNVLSDTKETPATSRCSTRRDDQQGYDNQADVAGTNSIPEDWFFLKYFLCFLPLGFHRRNEEEYVIYKQSSSRLVIPPILNKKME